MIRVLVADDEPLARENLVRILARDAELRIAGIATGGNEALAEIERIRPEVVFLDIEMPGKTGLEVASNLAAMEAPPLVVFVTAHNKYAIQAFEANAMDYILKPPDAVRVAQTLERVKSRLGAPESGRERLLALEEALIQKGLLKKIAAHRRNAKDRVVLDPRDVYYFHAHLADVLARTETEELIVNATLKELLGGLLPGEFVQTHKSYVVNVGKVEKVSPMFSGNFEIVLKHPAKLKIPLSRRFAKSLKASLGNW